MAARPGIGGAPRDIWQLARLDEWHQILERVRFSSDWNQPHAAVLLRPAAPDDPPRILSEWGGPVLILHAAERSVRGARAAQVRVVNTDLGAQGTTFVIVGGRPQFVLEVLRNRTPETEAPVRAPPTLRRLTQRPRCATDPLNRTLIKLVRTPAGVADLDQGCAEVVGQGMAG